MLTTAARGAMLASMPNSVATTHRNTEETAPGAALAVVKRCDHCGRRRDVLEPGGWWDRWGDLHEGSVPRCDA